MGPNPVRAFKMEVGAKGGGKHWTKEQVARRKAAEEKVKAEHSIDRHMPRWLSSPAKAIWEKTVRNLKDSGILDRADADVLATYCDACARVKELAVEIDKKGYTVHTVQGVKTNPLVTSQQNYIRIQMTCAEKLGITATGRARLAKKMSDEKEADPDGGMFD